MLCLGGQSQTDNTAIAEAHLGRPRADEGKSTQFSAKVFESAPSPRPFTLFKTDRGGVAGDYTLEVRPAFSEDVRTGVLAATLTVA